MTVLLASCDVYGGVYFFFLSNNNKTTTTRQEKWQYCSKCKLMCVYVSLFKRIKSRVGCHDDIKKVEKKENNK